MPSNPKLQRLTKFLREHHGGEEALLDLLRSGWTGVRIARHLEKSALEDHHIPRDEIALSPDSVRLLIKRFDEPAYHEALKDGAASLMEETVEIADDVPANRDEVAKAKLRIDARVNIAGKMDREKWGDTPPSVNVNIAGQQFLQAVSRPGALPPPKKEVVVEATPAPEVKALPPQTAVQRARAEVEREEERKNYIEALIRNGLSRIEAERAAIQWDHDHPPAVVYACVKPEEEELE